jgi:hypothetical protein
MQTPVSTLSLTDVEDTGAERASRFNELRLKWGHRDYRKQTSPAKWLRLNSGAGVYKIGLMKL